MERKIDCLRCGERLNHITTNKIQLGQTGWILGDLPNLFAGALEVDIYRCPNCKKIELFSAEEEEEEEKIPEIKCPRCGKMHDFDYPKCPFCKYDYNV